MIIQGDARDMSAIEAESVQCVVTSPPYWGLRDYGTATWEGGDAGCDHKGPPPTNNNKGNNNSENTPFKSICGKCGARRIDRQIGLEATPDEYVATMVQVFAEVKRVLRDDGTVWLNLGDSYAGGAGGRGDSGNLICGVGTHKNKHDGQRIPRNPGNLKPKDLIGIPWRVAFALQADGWYLRSDIIWAKPNPMPESVTDRPTRSHEYIFLLSKSERYFYDADAIKEQGSEASKKRLAQPGFDSQTGGAKDYGAGSNRSARRMLVNLKDKQRGHSRRHDGFNDRWDSMSHEEQCSMMVNKRDVWNIACEPTPEAHFATFPQKLIEPCILAGSRPGDLVLDPFLGSGTTGKVCERLGRRWVGVELSEAYIEIAKKRTAQKGFQI